MKTALRTPYLHIGRNPAPVQAPGRETHYMKSALTACVIGAMAVSLAPLPAQTPPPAPQVAPAQLTQEELSQLLAPIALYPDALIALILPASTVPSDVVMGARYVAGNGDPTAVGGQPWDDSVKSLTRYPDVLSWMDQNLDWTASVGEAFINQPADVMNAVQALRAQARAAGSLVDTPEQKVVVEEEYIRIVPADPEIIYVPQYDPQVVYVESYTPSIISFGVGFAVGSWLNYDFDWRRRCVYRGNWRGWNHNDWNNGWRGGGGNNVNVVNIDVTNVTPWQASANSQRQITQRQRNNTGNARIVNARSQQSRNNVAANLPAGATFNPGTTTAVPRPSRLNVNNQRTSRTDRPNRPETGKVASETPRNLGGGNRSEQRQRPPTTPAPQAATTPPSELGSTSGERPEQRRNRDVTQAPPRGTPSVAGSENGRPGRERPPTPSTPPKVTGQLGQPMESRKGSQGSGFNPRNRPSGQDSESPRRSSSPSLPPQIQRPSAPAERPSQPRENPPPQTVRPQQSQQPRPQQTESRPKPQQAPRQQQQSRPQQPQPAPQVQPQQEAPRQPRMARPERQSQSMPQQPRQERPPQMERSQQPRAESRSQAPQQSAQPQGSRGSGDGSGKRGHKD